MKQLSSNELRALFLKFFQKRVTASFLPPPSFPKTIPPCSSPPLACIPWFPICWVRSILRAHA